MLEIQKSLAYTDVYDVIMNIEDSHEREKALLALDYIDMCDTLLIKYRVKEFDWNIIVKGGHLSYNKYKKFEKSINEAGFKSWKECEDAFNRNEKLKEKR